MLGSGGKKEGHSVKENRQTVPAGTNKGNGLPSKVLRGISMRDEAQERISIRLHGYGAYWAVVGEAMGLRGWPIDSSGPAFHLHLQRRGCWEWQGRVREWDKGQQYVG